LLRALVRLTIVKDRLKGVGKVEKQ